MPIESLTPNERARLDELEGVIQEHLEGFVAVGPALREIRESRLYRGTHPSFDRYCHDVWGFTGSHGHNLINCAAVAGELVEDTEIPVAVQSHAAALLAVEDREERARLWAAAHERANGGRVTARSVRRVIEEARGEDTAATDHTPRLYTEPEWPWGDGARAAFDGVRAEDQGAVREALVRADELGETVTAETVGDAVAYVAAERAEDGRVSRVVVVGRAVEIVEENRRLLTGEPEVQPDIDVVPDDGDGGDAEETGYTGGGPLPLLVVIPVSLCPTSLLVAHGQDVGVLEDKHEVIVEVGELADHSDVAWRDEEGNPVVDVEAVREAAREAGIRKTFNKTGDLVGWARYSTNPLTGCSHRCSREFCYASDLALLFYPQAFVPTIHPARLDAFRNTAVPDPERFKPWERAWSATVFLGSMGDLMNVSFPDWWVQAVIDEVAEHPEWTVFVLTKLSTRLGDFTWPDNVAVGVTVTQQAHVRAAAAGLTRVDSGKFKWVSVEPFLGPIDPTPLLDAGATFFAVGGRSRTRWADESQPDPGSVEDLARVVLVRGGHVYPKTNLSWRAHIPIQAQNQEPPAATPDVATDAPAPAPDRAPARPRGPRSGGETTPADAPAG